MRKALARTTTAREHEPAPASDHSRARHHTDPGLGFELLSAGDSGRSDRARPRRFRQLDICRVFGVAGDLRRARPARRTPDRPRRRQVGAVAFQSDAGRRTGVARVHLFDPGADRGLDPARHRHGLWPVRCGLCRARTHLWRPRAPGDHRHHPDRGFCQHGRMAADRLGTANHRLAQHLLCLGGGAYPDRPAAQSPHAAAVHGREGGGRDRGQAAHPDRSHHGPAGVRLCRGLERHRRDGGASAADSARPRARPPCRRWRPAR